MSEAKNKQKVCSSWLFGMSCNGGVLLVLDPAFWV